MQNTGLGRGLGSLIPNKQNPPVTPGEVQGDKSRPGNNTGFLEIGLEEIKTNPGQPRKTFDDIQLEDLAASIKEHGIIQPLVVNPIDSGYELIAGERRLRAAKLVGLLKVPVVIRKAGEQEKLELALIENIQREDLNAIELATAYKQLMDEFGLTQEELGKRVGRARSVVANTMRLLNLPDEIQVSLIGGKISETHAKYIVGLDTEAKQMTLYRKIVHNKMSVADTSKEVKHMGGTKKARIKINYGDKDKEFALREFFGTKVEIKRKGRGGQIIIDYFSDDELDEIVKKVQ